MPSEEPRPEDPSNDEKGGSKFEYIASGLRPLKRFYLSLLNRRRTRSLRRAPGDMYRPDVRLEAVEHPGQEEGSGLEEQAAEYDASSERFPRIMRRVRQFGEWHEETVVEPLSTFGNRYIEPLDRYAVARWSMVGISVPTALYNVALCLLMLGYSAHEPSRQELLNMVKARPQTGAEARNGFVGPEQYTILTAPFRKFYRDITELIEEKPSVKVSIDSEVGWESSRPDSTKR